MQTQKKKFLPFFFKNVLKIFEVTIEVYGKKVYIGPYQTQSILIQATNQPSNSFHIRIVKLG